MKRRNFLALSGAFGAGTILPASWAVAQGREETLRVLSEGAPNSFDSFSLGVNRNAIQVTWNIYDRLVKFGTKARSDGTTTYDYFDIQPELAESYAVSDDQTAITFHLRRDAVFHDGSPITAEDVKWSLDRVVASPIGLAQFRTGSMTDPAQFVVVDDHTLRIDLPQPDRFALPNLALTYPIIVNRRLALEHATDDDPWAGEWLRSNPAGGGAYRIAQARIGERIVFERFDDWKSGALPALPRVLWQIVPAAESRVAALIKGDTDVAQDLPPKDVADLQSRPSVQVVGTPGASFQFLAMNTQTAPFDDIKVRQAIACALPYEAMFRTALFERGLPLFGGNQGKPESTTFPQPLGYATDLERARDLMAKSSHPDGFETTFSFELSLATVAEPLALLVQEALAGIGINVTINKVPAGQLGTLLQDRKVPFYFEASTAYLADPDYFFRIFYHGDTRWNFGAYQSAEFSELVARTRFETDPRAYEADVLRMIELAREDLPIILLWRPSLDIGLYQSVAGYSASFHPQLDYRPLHRG